MNTTNPTAQSFAGKYRTKLLFIGFISVVLIIASSAIWLTAYDRERSSEEVNNEVIEHWGRSVVVHAPVISNSFDIFPETINYVANLENEQLSRNIYTTNVYTATVSVSGTFDASGKSVNYRKSNFSLLVDGGKILECSELSLGSNKYQVDKLTGSLSVDLDTVTLTGKIPFSLTFKVRGSESIRFLPFTAKNSVTITGNCPMPSFKGVELPVERTVSNNEFKAKWVNINTSLFPESDRQDHDQDYNYEGVRLHDTEEITLSDYPGDCEVEFVTGVDSYRKVVRAIKYAYLIILLTFIAVFATEVLSRRNVPLLNYFLIGAALIVFYTLLLSIAELIGFDLGYLIAAIMTVGLITLYLRTSVGSSRLAAFNGLFLSIIYGCCYIMICMGTLALLIGSLMIFLAIAGSMFVSLRINRR